MMAAKTLVRLGLRALTVLGLVLALAGVWIWLTWMNPFVDQPWRDPTPLDTTREHAVFVYGTLRHPLVRWVVIGRQVETRPAMLSDHVQEGLDVRPAPGARVEGLLLAVDADALRRLDHYERLGVRYERVERPLASGERAWVYQRLQPPRR